MKIEDMARPAGLMAIGMVGIAATALLGFAAGVAVSRDPEALKRTARRVAREAARGLERVSLMAAQTREHVADLWAEAREEALAEVDAADFERAARRGAAEGPGAAAAKAAKAAKASKEASEAEPPAAAAPRPRRAAKPRSRRAAARPADADSGA